MTEIISWKGKTFNQISSIIKKNSGEKTGDKSNYFRANPLKIYRRELSEGKCNERISFSIDKFNGPGGMIVNTESNKDILGGTLDINLTESKYERPGTGNCSERKECFNHAENARRRVRSSGMITKKYNAAKNNDTYYTSSKQYLESRNKKFEQNQYYNIRQGEVAVKPGSNSSIFNVYASNGMQHCNEYVKVQGTVMKYKWIDNENTDYEVIIPEGNYKLSDINKLLQSKMDENGHYYVNKENNTKIFLLSISYGSNNRQVQINVDIGGKQKYPSNTGKYEAARNFVGVPSFVNPENDIVPQLILNDNEILEVLGFNAGTYPENSSDTTERIILSQNNSKLKTSYVSIHYKPSNSKFANQGGVESSARTVRLKYDSITNSTKEYGNAYGNSVANAYAYGLPHNAYTIKDKIGYPNKCTPKFPKKCNS